MHTKNFKTFFDCGFSKIRAGVFDVNNKDEAFYAESEFFTNQSNIEINIEQIIISLEKKTNKYIDDINLMIDSPKTLSIGISFFKKLDGSQLRKENIQFLVQEAKQQILKYYINHNIAHIMINNYKIDNIDYSYLPDEINCQFISLDIFFICLPSDLVLYFKNIFLKSNISINQIICSSYVKSINYKYNLNLNEYVSFIDIGFNRTSIISYINEKIISLDVLPIGGNHITKDISKILNIPLEQSEKLKRNFNQNQKFLREDTILIKTLQKIIFARAEEILELCARSSVSNFFKLDQFKIVLMGEGSKIINKQRKDKNYFSKGINFFDETLEDICESAFKFNTGLNKQEVVVVAKKQIKQGFFEKLFHFFK